MVSQVTIAVVRQCSYDEAQDLEDACGGMGGWVDGEDFDEYLAACGDEALPYVRGLRDWIVREKIRHGGDWHQDDEEGVPVFADGKCATFSYRAWGDLLAAVWNSHERTDRYCYMSFYMERLVEPPPLAEKVDGAQ